MRKGIQKKKVEMLLKRESEVWLYSYADLITNLLAFFMLLVTMSSMDAPQMEKVRDSIRKTSKHFGGETNRVQMEFASVVTKFIRENDLKNTAAVQKEIDGISLTFTGGFFFDTLSADLTPEARKVLTKLTPLFERLPKNYRIDISGHADSRPVSDDSMYASNWELSAARAASVVRHLASQGVAASRMRAIGYADTKPVSKNMDQNRRVVIKIGQGVGL